MGVKIVQNCLHIAASNGHFKICVKLFQDYSFDIHAKDDDGLSVLHSAAESGDLELFQNLIEYESDVCTETKDLKNCLHIPARIGNVNLCKEIIVLTFMPKLIKDLMQFFVLLKLET